MGGCVDREAKFAIQKQQEEFFSEFKVKSRAYEVNEADPSGKIATKHDNKSTFIISEDGSKIKNKRSSTEILIPKSKKHRSLDTNSVKINDSVNKKNSVESAYEEIELEDQQDITSKEQNRRNESQDKFPKSDLACQFQLQSFPSIFFEGGLLTENPPAKSYHISLELKDWANILTGETDRSELCEALSLESQRILEIRKNTKESVSQTKNRHAASENFSTYSLHPEGYNPQRYSVSDFNPRKTSPRISSGKPKFSSSKFGEIIKKTDKKVPRKIKVHKSQLKRKLKLRKCEEIEIYAIVPDPVKMVDRETVTDLSAAELSSHDNSFAKVLNSKRSSLDKTDCSSPDAKFEHHQPDESLSYTPARNARAHLRVSTSVTYNKAIAPDSPLLATSPMTCKLLERKSTIVHNLFPSQPYIRPCLGRSLTSIRE